MGKNLKLRLYRLAFLYAGITLSLMLGACAKKVQTIKFLDPQTPSAHMVRQPEQNIESLKSTDKEPKKNIQFYEAQGDQAFVNGNIDDALAAYGQALSLRPLISWG